MRFEQFSQSEDESNLDDKDISLEPMKTVDSLSIRYRDSAEPIRRLSRLLNQKRALQNQLDFTRETQKYHPTINVEGEIAILQKRIDAIDLELGDESESN